MHTMRHPLHNLPSEGLGAMHAGIVEHHHGEGVGVFLGYKMVKRVDDRIGGHGLGGGVIDQLPCSAEKSQYVQPSAM